MIEAAIRHKAKQLQNELPYLSIVGGLAWPQFINVDGTNKLFPACAFDDGAKYMIPDTSQTAVCYFEATESDTVYSNAQITSLRSPVRLVVWLNMARLSGSFEQIQGDIIRAVLKEPDNRHPFLRINTTLTGTVTGSQIFARWSYNESELQYLMHPYKHFALSLDVRFTLPVNCVFETVQTTSTQC